jgi:threonine/homoserine/homoserine lactone efflux protein
MGATTGDLIYVCIGVFSLNTIAASLIDHKDEIYLVSGLFLCYLGVKIFLDKSAIQHEKITHSSSNSRKNRFLNHYASALLVSVINPLTTFPFVAAFTQLYTMDVQISRNSARLF